VTAHRVLLVRTVRQSGFVVWPSELWGGVARGLGGEELGVSVQKWLGEAIATIRSSTSRRQLLFLGFV
jgi:hypothetical protein